jgi:hypothetical protein
MKRTTSLLSGIASIAVCLVITSSVQASALDRVRLRVSTQAIDGSLLFATADGGWVWRCRLTGNRTCSLTAERGQTIVVTAQNGASSTFNAWDGACAAARTQPTCTLQLNNSLVSATARFWPLRLWMPAFGRGYLGLERYPDEAPL